MTKCVLSCSNREGGKKLNPSDRNFVSKKGRPSFNLLSYLLDSHTPKKSAEIQTNAMDDSKLVYSQF